jgi:predicted acetyltransferase
VTTPHDDLQLRVAADDEYDAVAGLLSRAFGSDLGQRAAGVFEPARNLVFVDGGAIIANAGAYTRDVAVPGGVVPAAHVTLVSVNPTYRRRGLLTRLMHRQLRDVREAGVEPIAILWASEGRIYQRFGYGSAAPRLSLMADRREVRFLPRLSGATGGGWLREAVPDDVRDDLVALHERVRGQRVGWSSRNDAWWTFTLADPKDERDGASARQAVLYGNGDGVQGYALWRLKPSWTPEGPAGETIVGEVVAATREAYTALWRFLFSVDLTRTVNYWCAAPDEPLLHMVEEPRALGGRHMDSLWLRLADVPAALCARRYLTPLEIVLEIDDPLLPENAGRWLLRASAEGVTCVPAPVDSAVDLACDVADLGAAYLGGVPLTALASAGRVREVRAGALGEASIAFGWHRAPSVTDSF